MVNEPEVSILMPVKNAEPFLDECIQSIRQQSFVNWELIAVDDHSDDQSSAILSDYSDRDNRVKTIKNKGDGIIDALCTAYDTSKGSFITRMDADDVMLSNKIQLLLEPIKDSPLSLSIGHVEYFSQVNLGNGYQKYAAWLNSTTEAFLTFERIYRECTVPSPCWMTSRMIMEKCGAFREDRYPEDYDLAFRFKKIGTKLCPVNHIVHRWRDHPNRTSRTDQKYADNQFTPLKVFHFIKQDYSPAKPLVLWGAGRKGKQIAKSLLAHQLEFIWITNNPKKIGHDIYDIRIVDWKNLENAHPSQVIISISSESFDESISAFMTQYTKHKYFRFS